MTSTAGGATWSTAGTLQVGTSPQTGLANFAETSYSGGLLYSAGNYVTYWTFTADSYLNVTMDASTSVGAGQTDIYVRSGGTGFDSSDYVQQATGDGFSDGHAKVVWLAQPGVTYHVALVAVAPDPADTFAVTSTARPTPVLTAGTDTFGHGDWETGWYELPFATVITGYWLVTSPVAGEVTVDFSASTADPAIATAVVFEPDGAGQFALVTYDGNFGDQPSPTVTFTAEAGVTYVLYAFVDTPDEAGLYAVTTTFPVGPMGLSVTFDGSDVEITGDLDAAYQFADDGLVMPPKQARIRYAADSDWTHGSVALASQWQQSLLSLRVRVEGTSETDLASKVAALEEAIGAFSYDVTVTRDAQTTTWRADQGSMQLDQSRQFYSDKFVEVWAVTIPVYPIPS